MVTRHVAVVNESQHRTAAAVAKAVAAVRTQVADDFGPAWGVTATVDPVAALDDVPPGHWPVVVRDDIGINVPGVHLSDGRAAAFALVLFTGDRWTVTLSRQVLGMLADPFGTAVRAGPSVRRGGERVEYLVGVCDPCGDDGGYRVAGVQVSDFVLPAYYDGAGPGRYSFAGGLTAPRTVRPSGSVTWREPASGRWWQRTDTGGGPRTRAVTTDVSLANVLLRDVIARMTAPRRGRAAHDAADRKRVYDLMRKYARTTAAQADWWRGELEQLARRTTAGGPPAG